MVQEKAGPEMSMNPRRGRKSVGAHQGWSTRSLATNCTEHVLTLIPFLVASVKSSRLPSFIKDDTSTLMLSGL